MLQGSVHVTRKCIDNIEIRHIHSSSVWILNHQCHSLGD